MSRQRRGQKRWDRGTLASLSLMRSQLATLYTQFAQAVEARDAERLHWASVDLMLVAGSALNLAVERGGGESAPTRGAVVNLVQLRETCQSSDPDTLC
jgi:hypothetical protein